MAKYKTKAENVKACKKDLEEQWYNVFLFLLLEMSQWIWDIVDFIDRTVLGEWVHTDFG